MVEEVAGLVALNALIWAAGMALLELGSIDALRRRVFLAYVIGFAWLGVVGSLLLVMRRPLNRWEIICVALAPAAAALVARRGSRPRGAVQVLNPWWVAVPGVVMALTTLVRSTAQPLGGWDAWSFWTPKAESIVYFDGLSGPFFRSGVANPDYPLLIPALESSAFRFMGQMDTTLVHVQFALLALAFIGALADVLAGWADPRRLSVVLVLVAAAPAVYTQTLDAYADVPIAIFTSVGALLLWQSFETRDRRRAGLGLLLLAAAMATKVEGLVFTAAVVASFAWAYRKSARDVRWLLAGALVAGVTAVVPWRLWLLSHDIAGAYRFSIENLIEHPDRYGAALATLVGDLASPARWLLLPLVVVVATGLGFVDDARRRAAGVVAGASALSILGLGLVYWGTSYPFEWHLETSAGRVVTTPLLLAASFSAALMSSAERSDARARASASTRRLGEQVRSPAPAAVTRVT
jgi:hypothetical protein